MKCTTCNQPVRPVVAIDLDGTLGDYHNHFLDFAEGYLGYPLPRHWTGDPKDWEDYLGLDKRVYRDVKLAFRQGGMKRTMPRFNGASFLTRNVSSRGAEVFITTTRPWNRLDSVDPDTQEWLKRNGIYYDYLLYDEDKYQRLLEIVGKGRVCAVLEDLPEQVARAEEVFGPGTVVLHYGKHNTVLHEEMLGSQDLYECTPMLAHKVERWYENNGH